MTTMHDLADALEALDVDGLLEEERRLERALAIVRGARLGLEDLEDQRAADVPTAEPPSLAGPAEAARRVEPVRAVSDDDAAAPPVTPPAPDSSRRAPAADLSVAEALRDRPDTMAGLAARLGIDGPHQGPARIDLAREIERLVDAGDLTVDRTANPRRYAANQ